MMRTALLCAALALVGAGCAPPKPSAAAVETCPAAAPAMAKLDELLDRFNARDVAGWNATFHFPNVVVSGGVIRTFASPDDQKDVIDGLVRQGWVRSEWSGLRVVQCAPQTVHVAGDFLRYRADGSLLSRTSAIYGLDFRDGRWGVTLRSLARVG